MSAGGGLLSQVVGSLGGAPTAAALVAGGIVVGALGGGAVAGGVFSGGSSATSTGELAVYPCPDVGPALFTVPGGQEFLVTGKTGDGTWLRIHNPLPGRTEAWVETDPLTLEGALADLPVAECAPEIEAAAASVSPNPSLTALQMNSPSPSPTPTPAPTDNPKPSLKGLTTSVAKISYDTGVLLHEGGQGGHVQGEGQRRLGHRGRHAVLAQAGGRDLRPGGDEPDRRHGGERHLAGDARHDEGRDHEGRQARVLRRRRGRRWRHAAASGQGRGDHHGRGLRQHRADDQVGILLLRVVAVLGSARRREVPDGHQHHGRRQRRGWDRVGQPLLPPSGQHDLVIEADDEGRWQVVREPRHARRQDHDPGPAHGQPAVVRQGGRQEGRREPDRRPRRSRSRGATRRHSSGGRATGRRRCVQAGRPTSTAPRPTPTASTGRARSWSTRTLPRTGRGRP